MARNTVKTGTVAGVTFVMGGADQVEREIKKIENAAIKVDKQFVKTAVAAGNMKGAILGAASQGAAFGPMGIAIAGAAAILFDNFLPVALDAGKVMGQAAINALGFGDEINALKQELSDFGEYWAVVTGKMKDPLKEEFDLFKNTASVLKARAEIEAAIDEEERNKKLKEEEAEQRRLSEIAQANAKRLKEKLQKIDEADEAARKARAEQARSDARAKAKFEAAEKLRIFREAQEQEQALERAADEFWLTWENTKAERRAAIRERERIATLNMIAEVEAKQAAIAQQQIESAQHFRSALLITNQAAMELTRSLVDGSKTTEQAFEDMGVSILRQMINMILMEIQARAVATAVKAFEGQTITASVLGPAGVALAAGTAAAFMSAALAYKSQVPQLATGGLITGGIPGRDSVPAMLQPGEFVIPARETALMQAMMGRGGMGGGTTIVINQMIPDSRATDRMIKDQLIPSQRRLARLGVRA